MEKGTGFQKEKTLSGNSYYEKEEGRPYSFAQKMYKFLIAYTGGNTKGIGNLNSAFEKADSPPLNHHLPRKRSRLAKSQ
jgi:hypothetical protein